MLIIEHEGHNSGQLEVAVIDRLVAIIDHYQCACGFEGLFRLMQTNPLITVALFIAIVASTAAHATKPGMPVFRQGCVFEGFLLPVDQRPNYDPLPDTSSADWTRFEGKLVRFSVRQGRQKATSNNLLATPEIIGECAKEKYTAQLAYAWFSEAIVRMGGPARKSPLPAIDRALALDPHSCDAATLRAFVLEREKRWNDAIAQLNKAATEMKCGRRPARTLNDDNHYETKLPIED